MRKKKSDTVQSCGPAPCELSASRRDERPDAALSTRSTARPARRSQYTRPDARECVRRRRGSFVARIHDRASDTSPENVQNSRVYSKKVKKKARGRKSGKKGYTRVYGAPCHTLASIMLHFLCEVIIPRNYINFILFLFFNFSLKLTVKLI